MTRRLMLKIWVRIFHAVAIFILFSGGASASADTPPNWPWHGVVLEGVATAEDIKRLADYGANSVVILLSPRFWAQNQKITPKQAWQFSLDYADTILDACKKHGVTGILSVSQIPIDPTSGLSQESRVFWEDPVRLMEAINVAGSLAQHFHNRGNELGAYEILNEPVIRDGSKVEFPKTWPGLVRGIVGEIRKYDAKRFVAVSLPIGGLPGEYGEKFQPLADANIIYNAHMYMPYDYTHQGVGEWSKRDVEYPGMIGFKYWDSNALEKYMFPLLSFQRKYNVPVWIGEFSAIRYAPNSDQYLSDLLTIFDKHGLGWSYYSFKGFHGWNPSCGVDFSSIQCSDENTLRWQLLKRNFSKAH